MKRGLGGAPCGAASTSRPWADGSGTQPSPIALGPLGARAVGETSQWTKEQAGNVPNRVYTNKVHKMPSRMFRGGALLLEEASTSRGQEQAVETLRMEEDKKGEVKIQGFPLLLHQRHPSGEAMTVHIALLFNCSGQGSS